LNRVIPENTPAVTNKHLEAGKHSFGISQAHCENFCSQGA
jgi:(2Fe-2S) ferredoxin